MVLDVGVGGPVDKKIVGDLTPRVGGIIESWGGGKGKKEGSGGGAVPMVELGGGWSGGLAWASDAAGGR